MENNPEFDAFLTTLKTLNCHNFGNRPEVIREFIASARPVFIIDSLLFFMEENAELSARTSLLSQQLSECRDGVQRVDGDNKPKLDPIVLRSIAALSLTTRSTTCLKNEKIWLIGDLIQRSERDLKEVPNLGKKSLQEIKEALEPHNLHVGMRIPDWPPADYDELVERSKRQLAL